jgi:acyl-CoA dehydrogenase
LQQVLTLLNPAFQEIVAMLDTSSRTIFNEDQVAFRDALQRFIAREFEPAAFEADGKVSREFWRKAGEAGLLCPTVAEGYGGPGLDFTFGAVINEELSYAASDCLMPQTELSLPCIVGYGTEKQKPRWLPKWFPAKASPPLR